MKSPHSRSLSTGTHHSCFLEVPTRTHHSCFLLRAKQKLPSNYLKTISPAPLFGRAASSCASHRRCTPPTRTESCGTTSATSHAAASSTRQSTLRRKRRGTPNIDSRCHSRRPSTVAATQRRATMKFELSRSSHKVSVTFLFFFFTSSPARHSE